VAKNIQNGINFISLSFDDERQQNENKFGVAYLISDYRYKLSDLHFGS